MVDRARAARTHLGNGEENKRQSLSGVTENGASRGFGLFSSEGLNSSVMWVCVSGSVHYPSRATSLMVTVIRRKRGESASCVMLSPREREQDCLSGITYSSTTHQAPLSSHLTKVAFHCLSLYHWSDLTSPHTPLPIIHECSKTHISIYTYTWTQTHSRHLTFTYHYGIWRDYHQSLTEICLFALSEAAVFYTDCLWW